jgi:putative phage-type endonuclease
MKLLRLQQGTDAWLRWRHDGIGGSDIAAIMGVSPYDDATRGNVMLEKVDRIVKPSTYAMRAGLRLEPRARAMFEQRSGLQFMPTCVEHAEENWIRCSLDGIAVTGTDARGLPSGWELLEIKAPTWTAHDRILSGIVPTHFMLQVQWQLLATGLDVCHLVSITENVRFDESARLAVVRIEADAEQQAEILDAATEFWREVIEARGGVPVAA